MMAGFDNRGRLFVACSAGKNIRAPELMKDPPNFIKMLEDTDGDGKFDKATVFADKMTLPMGALWYRGALYVASPPHIWKLEDTNDDGVADKRTILVDKFGFSGNAASVHGCFLGPCGRIYWCDGRHGHEFKDKNGKLVSKGKAARIFSCKPDGSDVRVHCGGGMDNPVEVDFTETGEMIGSVNILIGRPRGDCLMHWVEGGVYPRYDQQQCLDEFKQTGDPLPPMTNLGHVAVSGMTRYRSDQFGKTYQNNIFTTLFNTHKVIRSELKRSGSTFTTTEHEFLTSDDPDFHPTDVFEDADGSLLVIDTGGWFRIGCPVSKVAKPDIYGAIYRIRRKGSHNLADPRGLKLDFNEMAAQEAVRYLDDARPAVREKAIERLALLQNVAIDELKRVIFSRRGHSATARRNAIWALRRGLKDDLILAARTILGKALRDPDESVVLAVATSLATIEVLSPHRNDLLINAMAESTPAFRRELVRALGRVKLLNHGFFITKPMTLAMRKRQISALCNAISMPGTDRVLEHTIIHSLIHIADGEMTRPFLKHKSPSVRRAALIALDQMEGGNLTRELVTPLLDTDDAELQKTALAIIGKHDGWAKETLTMIRKWFNNSAATEPGRAAPNQTQRTRLSSLRGFLVAQANDKAVQSLVAELLQSPKTDDSKRLLLLEVVERSSVRPFPKAWRTAIREALNANDWRVQLQAVRICGQHPLGFDRVLQTIATDPKHSIVLRAEAVIAAAPRWKSIDDSTLQAFYAAFLKDHPQLTLLAVARAISVAPLSERQFVSLAGTLGKSGPLLAPVLLRAFENSQSEAVGIALVKALSRSNAARSLPASELHRLLSKYPESVQSAAKPLLAKLGVNPAEQQRRISELLKSTAEGDAERGRIVFYSKKAACAGCHTIAGKGGRVGPDLSAIGKIRQHRDLVEAIAFPSATLARGFRSHVIATESGKIHTGLISRETSSEIILRDATLAEIRIPRNSIEAIRESPTSIMPKGLDKTLTSEELRDLLAYLRSLMLLALSATGCTQKNERLETQRKTAAESGVTRIERDSQGRSALVEFRRIDNAAAAIKAVERPEEVHTAVFLQCRDLKADDISALQRFPNLQRVELVSCTPKPGMTRGFQKLLNLSTLKLASTPFSADSLSVLATVPKLEELSLAGATYAAEALAGVSNLRQLRRLTIDRPGLRMSPLRGLKALPHLTELNLPRATLNDDDFAILASLQFLSQWNAPVRSMTDAGLAHWKGHPHLERLSLRESKVTDAGLAVIAQLSALRSLNLEGCTDVTDDGVKHILKCRQLTELKLLGSGITGEGASHLPQLKSLRRVTIGVNQITQAQTDALRKSLPECRAARKPVVCPQCGEAIPLNGTTQQQAPLKFAVRKVADESADDDIVPATEAASESMQFRCPGCDKQFVESVRAAGKRTTCPQCDTGFVIPATGSTPTQKKTDTASYDPSGEVKPLTAETADDPIEAAVAAYTSGKSAPAGDPAQPKQETGRFINTRTIIPIGLLLITLGGAAAIGGAAMTSMGMKQSFSASGLGGMSELTKDYGQLLQRLAQENGGQPGGVPVQPQIDPNQLQRQLPEQSPSSSSGQGLMIGGVVTGGIGSLLTFVGGIFLLAGLIGRFIEKSAS
eukprot:g8299.t1